MSCAALLARTPDPSDDQITAAMNGNICRCGTYLRIRAAVRRASTIAAATANERHGDVMRSE
jgi:isoquinoline 1-oxidoreductase alpha subunit